MPAMTVLYIGMLKLTSLAAVINVSEITFTAQTVIADVSRSLEAWVVVAATYIVVTIPATYAARSLERRFARGRAGR
jgi:polar amino acid transport system permease protein